MKDGSHRWFDGYQNQENVLLDDFCRDNGFNISSFLRFLDRYDVNVEVKGAIIRVPCKRIFITSNEHPSSWFQWRSTTEEHYAALCRRVRQVICFRDGLPFVADKEKFFDCAHMGPVNPAASNQSAYVEFTDADFDFEPKENVGEYDVSARYCPE